MKLLSLSTDHFKKLGTYHTTFTSGLNIIAGDNARGKSSLLEAIKMALFGVAAVPCKKEDIPTWGQTKASVTLVFQMSEYDVYTLVRTLTTAKLTKNNIDGTDELKANGHTPVTLFIEELTGLTLKDWELFIQSSQGSAAGILTFGATALNKKVEEFAGVDLIDKIQTLAQQRAGTIGARAEAKLVPAGRLADLEANVVTAEEAFTAADKAMCEAQEQLDNLPVDTSVHTGPTVAELREAQRVVDAASVDLDKAQVSVNNALLRVTEQAQRLEGRTQLDIAALEEELKALETTGTELGAQDKAFKAKEQASYSASETTDTHLSMLTKAKTDLAADPTSAVTEADLLQDLETAKECIATSKADITRETEVVGAAMSTYSNLIKLADGATCPTCKRAKEDHDPVALAKEAQDAREYLEQRQAYVAKLQDDLRVFEASKVAAESKLATKTRLQAMVDGLTSDYEARKATSDTLSAEVTAFSGEAIRVYEACQAAREKYAEVRQTLKSANEKNEALTLDQNTMRRLESELEVCEDHLADATKVLADLPEPATDAEIEVVEQQETTRREKLQARILQEHNLRNALTNATTARSRAVTDVQTACKYRDEALATNKAAEDDVAMAKRCERLVRFLRERRQTYLKEVWDTVMGLSSALVRKSSSGTISKVENRDGAFLYEEEGNTIATISASGAQKALIGTSLRMGLSRALYGGDALMIFDEPTEGCTEFNASNMVATLATSARQVLLITHRENDQALAKHVINVG